MNRGKCQVTLNMSENQNWTASFETSRNITFQVTSLPNKYCYVTIELQDRDPNFQLVADYQFKPNPGLLSTYKQGEKIDRISQLENRRTRFLKLKRNRGIIYISCLTNKQNNSFKIKITAKDQEQCDNECSLNGFCQVILLQQKSEGCVCLNSFIGNDCHQLSEKIVSRSIKDVEFFNTETIKYFSIDLYDSLGKDLRLEFESECEDWLAIIIYKTKALINPKDSNNSKYSQIFNITGGHGTILTQIPINLPESQRFLLFAVFKSKSYQDTNHLQIGFNYHSYSPDEDGQDSAFLASIIIPCILGPILLFILIKMGLKRYSNPGNLIFPFQNHNFDRPDNTQEHRYEMPTEYFRENRNSQPSRIQQNHQNDRTNTSLNIEAQINNRNSQQNRNNISYNLDSRPPRNNYSYNLIFAGNQLLSHRYQQSIYQNNNSNRYRNQILTVSQENQFLNIPSPAPRRPPQRINQIDECSICLSDLTNHNVVKTTCGYKNYQRSHKFHRDCIQQWFAQQRNCPNCRRPTSLQQDN
ncbi:unnamed protein product (macronuclear) [Paramecium tetraurelia]|uniref:RING-type domain-containing protein n=1 Tax=Paramecium tetraurelia TaxID=5888 RepID=A0E3I9_PARTE|nr:uncharacterized protein GSPATT00023029001 [Paramecium tetraurelia]CAK89856.1 unnamed protein product [Paramecium tetraurelia]|eukprot:XP_001457253.1 hypothetical protein (macronuclear) [Paramecium tetraurelia strain d4-2]